MKFVEIAKVDDIEEGDMKGYLVEGERVLLAKFNGKIYAVENFCSHFGGPLDKGIIEGRMVTCPWNFSEYDVTTGEVKHGPALESLRKYEIKIEGNKVLVNLFQDAGDAASRARQLRPY